MNLKQHARALESFDQSVTALTAGRASDALMHINAAIRLSPDSTAFRIAESRIHLALHDAPRALAALDAIAVYSPEDASRLDVGVLRAQAMVEAGRDGDALSHLESLIAQCPADATLRRLAASAAQRIGAIERQIEHLRHMVEAEPKDQVAARTLARLLAARNPHESVVIMANRCGDTIAAQWQATRWMVDAGRDADAEESYRAMLATNADDVELWLEAGEHAQRLGSHEVTIHRYSQALRLAPRNVRAAAGLARSHMRAGEFGAAAWWWFKVTRIDAGCVEAWASLAICGISTDRSGLTDHAERRLLPLTNEGQRMEALADAWLSAAAGDVIRQATRTVKSNKITASPLTWILQRSAEVLEAQSQRRPGWADTHYHAAVCRAALGDDDEARENVQAALDINPHYRAATSLAARLPKAA